MHNPNYGCIDTTVTNELKEDSAHVHIAIVNTLLSLFDRLDAGLPQLGIATPRVHDGAFIDAKYLPQSVFEACRLYGQKTGNFDRYIPIRGQGKSAYLGGTFYKPPTSTNKVIRAISETGLWHEEYIRARGMYQAVVDVDRTKLDVQGALAVAPGMPGSLTLHYGTARDHRRISSHYAAEIRKVVLEDGEMKEEWKQKGANHLLDCGGYAYARLDYEDWFLPVVPHEHDAAVAAGFYPAANPATNDGANSTRENFLPPQMTMEYSPTVAVPDRSAVQRRLKELGLL